MEHGVDEIPRHLGRLRPSARGAALRHSVTGPYIGLAPSRSSDALFTTHSGSVRTRSELEVSDDSRQVKWRGIRSTTTGRSWKPRRETQLICDFTVMAVSFYNVAENSGIE